MLATLSGDICLLFGLALLLLPLLAAELSRPRDGVWGAVVLILGLVLVTSSDRMRGCLLYTSPSPRDATLSRMPSSA